MVRHDGQLMRSTFLLLVIIALSACAGLDSGTESATSVDANTQSGSFAGMKPASLALLHESQAQQARGEYGQAAATLERAIRIDSTHPGPWIELGRVRLMEGNFQQAEQVGRKAQSLAVGNPAAESASLQLIIDALRSQGRYLEARELTYDD